MKNILFIYILILQLLIAQEVFEGYTLFTPQAPGDIQTRLITNDYLTEHTWGHDRGPASMPYLIQGDEPGLENTVLVYPYRVPNPTMDSGGVGGGVQLIDWNGNILWDYVVSNAQYQHHHDIQPMPNGNILLIAWEAFTDDEAEEMGRIIPNDGLNELNQMWSTAILEVQPNLDDGSSLIVWEWHLWDHLVQNTGSNYGATYSIDISDHPELLNINEGTVGSGGGAGGANADWIHTNAIDYNETLDQIVISSRFMSEIYIIDHSTTTEEAASHEGGDYGKGGDLLYRWGNPQIYNRGSISDQILDDQHSVNWIDENYEQGSGNLILFNNRHDGNESAGLEFVPPLMENGTYAIDGDNAYGPDSPIWVYHPGGSFHTNVQGGALRLPNGNTLLTIADDTEMYEVSYELQEVVWDYDYPGTNNVMIARVQKYALDYFDEILLGDVNSDGILNIQDVVLIVNMALGNIESNVELADMNNDGGINIQDVIILINIILN